MGQCCAHGAFETIGNKLMAIQAAYIRVVGDIRIELTSTSLKTGLAVGFGASLISNGSNHPSDRRWKH